MKRSAPAHQAHDKDISPPPTKRKIQSTTSSSAVSNFFKPASQKELDKDTDTDKLSWRVVDNSLLIGRYGPAPGRGPTRASARPVKIAAFDLDDTLISSTGSNKWARGADTWKWWHASVPGHVRSLHDQGYLVAIFSNQGNISLKHDAKKVQAKDTASLSNLKAQLASVVGQLGVPVSFYGAAAQDGYRKPRTGMWDELLKDYDLLSEADHDAADPGADPGADHGANHDNAAVDWSQCFYVGDAAGRDKTQARPKKDHASSDRDFAANVGIAFHTPEEFFLDRPAEPYEHPFEPRRWLGTTPTPTPTTTTTEKATTLNGGRRAPPPPPPLPPPPSASSTLPLSSSFRKKHKQELVITCGSPASGKSTYFWRELEPQGFKRVNQDILKSRDRCLRVAREFLTAGDSVAVDNTNADVETRKHWIGLARELGLPIRCIRFTTPARLCEHNDAVRALNPQLMNPERRTILPGIAFRSFMQRFQEPKTDEGFEDITTVDFEFKGTREQAAVWSKYWVSKFAT